MQTRRPSPDHLEQLRRVERLRRRQRRLRRFSSLAKHRICRFHRPLHF